jgi:hypothetical protein
MEKASTSPNDKYRPLQDRARKPLVWHHLALHLKRTGGGLYEDNCTKLVRIEHGSDVFWGIGLVRQPFVRKRYLQYPRPLFRPSESISALVHRRSN